MKLLMINVELQNITFLYSNGEQILKNFNLSIKAGSFVCLLGESGCGKSTILRLIAGLEKPQIGSIKIDAKPVISPNSSTGIVFQQPSLIPWLDVEDNLALGFNLRKEKIPYEDITKVLELTGIKNASNNKPNELSGGMAQRAAIARALLNSNKLLLMDEPFAALDALTKLKLQDELYNIWSETKSTILYITHDIEEAIYFGDRILIMSSKPGRIVEDIKVNVERPRQRDSRIFINELVEVKRKLFKVINTKNNG